jgi:GntR family transcriptional regulator, transcriptional repressor for pyruvate dehydrogenase complex
VTKLFNGIKKRESLSNIVATRIEEVIISKKLTTGSKLPSEKELGEKFNVSRTVIREALKHLNAKGLISIKKGKGAFVENVSVKNVTDILSLYMGVNSNKNMMDLIKARLIVEPSIAREASQNRTEDDLRKLRDNLKRTTQNVDLNNHAQLDVEFHLLVAEATHNDLMPLLIDPIHKLMPEIKALVMKNVPNARKSALKMHKEIIDAIESQNEEMAFSSMKNHLTIAYEHIEKAINKENNVKETLSKRTGFSEAKRKEVSWTKHPPAL